jgi:hypothetical protein
MSREDQPRDDQTRDDQYRGDQYRGDASHPRPEQPSVVPAAGWGAPARAHDAAWQQGGQPTAQQAAAGWGGAAPQGPGRRGMTRTQKGIAAAGVAVVLAAGAGAAVYAATGATTARANGQDAAGKLGPGGEAGFAQDGHGAGGAAPEGFGPAGMGAGMLGQVLHGEYVMLRNSENVTMVMQAGTVTAVSSGSVTVRSTDGFEQAYALTSETEYASRSAGRGQQGSQSGSTGSSSTLATGQSVSVTALKDGLSALTVMATSTSGTGGTTSGGSTPGGSGSSS